VLFYAEFPFYTESKDFYQLRPAMQVLLSKLLRFKATHIKIEISGEFLRRLSLYPALFLIIE